MIYIMEYVQMSSSVINENYKNVNEFLIKIFKSKYNYIKQACRNDLPSPSPKNKTKDILNFEEAPDTPDKHQSSQSIQLNKKRPIAGLNEDFKMDIYSLFSKYLLNNNLKFIYEIPTADTTTNNPLLICCNYNNFKNSFPKKMFVLNKNNFFNHNSKNLDFNLKLFYNLKVTLLTYANFSSNISKKVCTMCEKSLLTEEYIVHYYFCKEKKINLGKLSEIKEDFKLVLLFLKDFKKKILTTEKDYGIFSQDSDFNIKLKNSKISRLVNQIYYIN